MHTAVLNTQGGSQWHGVQAVWFAVPDAQAVRSGCAVGSWHSVACMLSERNLTARGPKVTQLFGQMAKRDADKVSGQHSWMNTYMFELIRTYRRAEFHTNDLYTYLST